MELENPIMVHTWGGLARQFRKRARDSGVAEIIGTILIFAIAITLFTTFILWYVPATGTANEQSYYQTTQSSFLSFAEKMSDAQNVQGQTSSYNIPTGISGVPPFSPSSPTSVSFSRNFDNFSVSMKYSIVVNYTPQGGSPVNYTVNVSREGGGVFKTAASTQFTTPTGYDLQDGMLLQSQGRSPSATAMGPLPVSLNSTSGKVSLGGKIMNVTGKSTTASSVGSTLAVLYYSSVNATSFNAGEFTAINGTTGTINTLTLQYFYYNLTSSFHRQWDYALFHQFNNTAGTFQQATSFASWNFAGLPFAANVNGETVSVQSTSVTGLSSVSLYYIDVSVLSV